MSIIPHNTKNVNSLHLINTSESVLSGEIMFYDRKKFFSSIRSKLAPKGRLSQSQVNGIEILLKEGERRNFNTEWIAYVLATAWHETGTTMEPVRETFADTDAQAIARLNDAWKKGRLKWVKKPYWNTGFFGRGYVQLTHEYNYKKMGEWLKIDLVKNKDLALDPEIAAQIIYEGMLRGMFTGKKLGDYLDGDDALDADDVKQYEAARKIVNGTDKAKTIAKYAIHFENALRSSEGVTPPVVVKKNDEEEIEVLPEAPQHEEKGMMKSTTIWAAIGTLITSIIGSLAALPLPVQILLIVLIAGFIFWIIRERLKGTKNIGGIF